MKVIDLIIMLNQMPPNSEVMFDATKEGAQMFKLISIDFCEMIETPENKNIVLLSSGIEEEEENLN